MAFSSFLIVLVIFVLTGSIIVRPFLVEQHTGSPDVPQKYDSLLADRERLLSAIEDLDLEFELEKISSKDHSRNRDILLAEAAEVLVQLDKLEKRVPKNKRISSPTESGDDLEEMIETRRRELKGDKSSFCSNCGKAVKLEDQFCGQCGEKL
ncbi:MAG: zinc ribbon domain-containing protein [Anaerolineales bacterium]|nr:zinc ribbon domain-containing protein [Anaerolineales bacterium]